MLVFERNNFSNKMRGSLLLTRISMRSSTGALPHNLRVRRAGDGQAYAHLPSGARCVSEKLHRQGFESRIREKENITGSP